MKTLIAVLTLTISMSAFSYQTGMEKNGPWTVGPLGYTDPLVSSQGTGVSLAGTSVGSSVGNPTVGSTAGSLAAVNMKVIALAIENDSQEYFQNGEMSVLLASNVEKIMKQNAELSVDEAVSVVLEFAHIHNN
ncbi:MAG: hypothetical protein H7281_05275 [Bacteriovorax sp.]|nr:hypothetical protein [Bacteriovorax sp.]